MSLFLNGMYRFTSNLIKTKSSSFLGSFSQIRHGSSSYEGDGKTSIRLLDQEAHNEILIDTFSNIGFRLTNGITILGPVVLFRRSVLSWKINGIEDLDEDKLSLFKVLEPKIDLLIIGIGDYTSSRKMLNDLFMNIRGCGVNVELLSTETACTTFNFLNSEGRNVAAALIPPTFLQVSEDDVCSSKIHYNTLIGENAFPLS